MTIEQPAAESAGPPPAILAFAPAPSGWWVTYNMSGTRGGRPVTSTARIAVVGWVTVDGPEGPEVHAAVGDGARCVPVGDVLAADDYPEIVHESEIGRCDCSSGDPMLSPDWWWCELHGALSEDAPCPR